MTNSVNAERRRQRSIMKVERALEDGMTVSEIVSAFKMPESTVRAWVAIIETTKKNEMTEEGS